MVHNLPELISKNKCLIEKVKIYVKQFVQKHLFIFSLFLVSGYFQE